MTRTRRILAEMAAKKVVYLTNPDANEWEPSVISLAGVPLEVASEHGGKIFVWDPESRGRREMISFKKGEVGPAKVSREEVRKRYRAALASTEIDPDDGDREHDWAAAKRIDNLVGEWVAFSNGDAKRQAMAEITANPEIRMNSLRKLYGELKAAGKVEPGFSQFLDTPIEIWRGSQITAGDPISATIDPTRTEIFGGGANKATILPSKIAYYVGGPEKEVWVSRRVFAHKAA